MFRLVIHLIAILLLALTSLPGPVLAEPSITVSPDPAPIGTRVSIRGTGFPADTILALTIATDTTPPEVLITIPVPTDEDGNFRAGLTTPATGRFAGGKHVVTVTKQDGGDPLPLATARFTLTSEAPSASSVATADTRTAPSVTTSDDAGRTIPTSVMVVAAIVLSIALLLLVLLSLRRSRAHTGRER